MSRPPLRGPGFAMTERAKPAGDFSSGVFLLPTAAGPAQVPSGWFSREELTVGKAARRRKQAREEHGPASRRSRPAVADRQIDSRASAEAALLRLVKTNPPGKISLAGAYVLGYSALGLAQQEEDAPDWYDELDPLETLFLGTAWPRQFRDSYEFANACTAWLRLMRGTVHWSGITRFVRDALAASEEHDLPVDAGELMLLLAGRLETAGLDQRKIPRNLLPEKLLDGARFAYGSAEDLVLPAPPTDAVAKVAQLWAATEVSMPNDGTAADALREGLHMLGNAGLDVHADPVVLLPCLYGALVAGDHEDLSDAGERSQAWALGLDPGSPLVPVTDVLLTAPGRGLDVDATLSCLFGIPAFTEQVSAEDRHWHSSPGAALTALAFELGYQQVSKLDHKVVRISEGSKAAFEAQVRLFEEKFGRTPGPQDPVFFDPDADQPQPVSLTGIEASTVAMLEAVGVCPAWIYAYQHTDGLLPRFDGSFLTERDQVEWDEHVDRYMALHDPEGDVDHDAETRKLQAMLVIGSLQMIAGDPQHGQSVVSRLTAEPSADDGETILLREYLHAWEERLTEQLRNDRAILETACEFARAWGGAGLADQVRRMAQEPAGEQTSDAALLAAAVVTTRW